MTKPTKLNHSVTLEHLTAQRQIWNLTHSLLTERQGIRFKNSATETEAEINPTTGRKAGMTSTSNITMKPVLKYQNM